MMKNFDQDDHIDTSRSTDHFFDFSRSLIEINFTNKDWIEETIHDIEQQVKEDDYTSINQQDMEDVTKLPTIVVQSSKNHEAMEEVSGLPTTTIDVHVSDEQFPGTKEVILGEVIKDPKSSEEVSPVKDVAGTVKENVPPSMTHSVMFDTDSTTSTSIRSDTEAVAEPNKCWNNEHIDVVLYYFRKKSKLGMPNQYSSDDLNTQEDIARAAKDEMSLTNIIKGFSIPADLSWHLVDKVYFLVNYDGEFHWILFVVVLKHRLILVYDSLLGSRKEELSNEIKNMSLMLLAYLKQSLFFEHTERTD